MCSSEAQSRDELFYLQTFLQSIGIVAQPASQPQGQGPDFILHGISPEVGVEVREVYREAPAIGFPMRQIEGVDESILHGAERLWSAEQGAPIEVWILFEKNRSAPKKSRIAELAHSIVEIVREAMPSVGECVRIAKSESPPEVPEEISSITIARPSKLVRSIWHPSGAAFEADLSVEHLQAEIEAKNEKYVCIYKSGDRAVWLLLVMDSHRLSGTHELTEELLAHHFGSRFARTFLLDIFTKRVIELRTHVLPEERERESC